LRKILDIFSSNGKIDNSETEFKEYEHIILEIIDDVIKKRKKIHNHYDQLVEKVWVSAKPLECKMVLAKYLLSRLLKESDRIFLNGQMLATKLCPKCRVNRKSFSATFYNFSDKTH